jgi:phenylalanyl-tRNA synthetase beta chain
MTNVTVRQAEVADLVGTEMSLEDLVRSVEMMGAGYEGTEGDSVTFDIFPSRPDMYSVEGIARSLRGFLGIEVGLPHFPATNGPVEFIVDKSVAAVRPFAVGGVVRGTELTDESVASLVDLQEKLHLTLGRRRRKVAIGIHDLDKVAPPFTYKAVHPRSVKFPPLGRAELMDLQEILDTHEKGKEYARTLAGKPLYPVITDANGVVLSFPPIINGVVTQLTPETRNLFIDVTGTDLPAVSAALTILCTALAERGGKIERVATLYPDRRLMTPDLDTKIRIVDVEKAGRLIGVTLTADEAVELLKRMRYDAHAQGSKVAVEIPAYRMDILHDWDVFEDIGIAYGFDKVPLELPKRQTIGDPLPMGEFAETLRDLLIGYGYTEVMTLASTSPKEPVEGAPRIAIQNPVSEEFSVVRSGLLGGVLNILKLNKHRELPQRVFEVGEVVVGGVNVRRLAAASVHPKASFTEMKSLVQSLLRDVGKGCEVEPAEDGNFIPGRCAAVVADGARVGTFGEVHPRVIDAYELAQPVAAFELDIEPLR